MSHPSAPRLSLTEITDRLRGGLIVSCQALPHEPLFGAEIMARMAVAAQAGGAVGIRANSPPDIAAIRAVTDLPLIGLCKVEMPGYDVYITPTRRRRPGRRRGRRGHHRPGRHGPPAPRGGHAAGSSAGAGGDGPPRSGGHLHRREALAAQDAGADFVSTTMSGYTPYSPQQPGPDLDLVARLASSLTVPLIAEGRIATPEQARAALDAGAFAVVVGGAITRPQQITARFAALKALTPGPSPASGRGG